MSAANTISSGRAEEFTTAPESFLQGMARLGRVKKCFGDLPLVVRGEPGNPGPFDFAACGLRGSLSSALERFEPGGGWDLPGHSINYCPAKRARLKPGAG
jgi:hypothetical protein